jgi:hypothetical protein
MQLTGRGYEKPASPPRYGIRLLHPDRNRAPRRSRMGFDEMIGEIAMTISPEKHLQNARQAEDDAAYWERASKDAQEKAAWYEVQMRQRLRDAAYYRSLAQREHTEAA